MVDIHTYAYIYKYTHILIYLYIHTYIHTYLHTHTYIHTYIHTYKHACIRTGSLGRTKNHKNRCLSCGDKLLTSASTIKVPGAVRIKISDPNIAYCSSCQLVYHLDDNKMLRESRSQPSFKQIECVKGHVNRVGSLSSSSSHKSVVDVDDRGTLIKGIDQNSTRMRNECKYDKDYRGRDESKDIDYIDSSRSDRNEEEKEQTKSIDNTPNLIKDDGSFGSFGTSKLDASKARSSKFLKKIQNARDDHFFNDHDMTF